MATVTNTIELPDGSTPDGVRVEIELVSSSGVRTAGWVTASDVAILSVARPSVVDGAWSVSLPANSAISPAGTRWKVTEYVGNKRYVNLIEVGSGGGSVHDLLVDS